MRARWSKAKPLPKSQSFIYGGNRTKSRRMPKLIRNCSPRNDIPTEAGRYWWTEWQAFVDVSKRGSSFYVTPPAKTTMELRITNNIAGSFIHENEYDVLKYQS